MLYVPQYHLHANDVAHVQAIVASGGVEDVHPKLVELNVRVQVGEEVRMLPPLMVIQGSPPPRRLRNCQQKAVVRGPLSGQSG